MSLRHDVQFLIRVKTRVPAGTIVLWKRSNETLLALIETLKKVAEIYQLNSPSPAFIQLWLPYESFVTGWLQRSLPVMNNQMQLMTTGSVWQILLPSLCVLYNDFCIGQFTETKVNLGEKQGLCSLQTLDEFGVVMTLNWHLGCLCTSHIFYSFQPAGEDSNL